MQHTSEQMQLAINEWQTSVLIKQEGILPPEEHYNVPVEQVVQKTIITL